MWTLFKGKWRNPEIIFHFSPRVHDVGQMDIQEARKETTVWPGQHHHFLETGGGGKLVRESVELCHLLRAHSRHPLIPNPSSVIWVRSHSFASL